MTECGKDNQSNDLGVEAVASDSTRTDLAALTVTSVMEADRQRVYIRNRSDFRRQRLLSESGLADTKVFEKVTLKAGKRVVRETVDELGPLEEYPAWDWLDEVELDDRRLVQASLVRLKPVFPCDLRITLGGERDYEDRRAGSVVTLIVALHHKNVPGGMERALGRIVITKIKGIIRDVPNVAGEDMLLTAGPAEGFMHRAPAVLLDLLVSLTAPPLEVTHNCRILRGGNSRVAPVAAVRPGSAPEEIGKGRVGGCEIPTWLQ